MFALKRIGVVRSRLKSVEELRESSNWSDGLNLSEIIVLPEYEKELEGIEDFLYIAVLHWMPRVEPKTEKGLPAELRKRKARDKGVFAKRTPLRPNPIGISIVELVERRGNVLIVKGLDAIDGTSILDIRIVSRCGPPAIGAGPMQSWEPYKRRIFKEKLVHTIVERAAIKKDGIVLDAGAGSGFLTFPIAPRSEVIALDRSSSMLKKLEALGEERSAKNISPVVGDVEAIPLKDGCMSTVASSFLLSLIPDVEKTVKEFVRILKPGGKMVLADFNLEEKPPELSEYFGISEGYKGAVHSQDELKGILEKYLMSEVAVSKWRDIIIIAEGRKPV